MREFILRWSVYFFGLIMLGLGIALTIKGQRFGVSSWDVFHIGLHKQFGLTIGSWSIIAGIFIVTFSCIVMRELPKVGTIINMATVGLFIDFFNWLIPDPATFAFQLIAFIVGIIVMGLAGGIYISAEVGAGPRDGLMLMMVSKLRFSITTSRTIMEVTVAIAGFLLGGPIGVGTVIMAFTLGPIMQFSIKWSIKILHKILGIEKEEVVTES